jgi:stalled ribosome rescue protein Dom34
MISVIQTFKKCKMTAKKHMGIWMDHSVAHLMEFTSNGITTNSVESEFTHQQKEHALSKSENLMHNKENHQQSQYYNKIKEAIKGFEDIVLFGPTTAKNELLNLLKSDHHFEKVNIDVKQADKMTENQQHAFVRHYFNP